MKCLIGLVGAIITMVVLKLLVNYLFKFTISEFMMGWICCMGYYIAIDAYEKFKS
jgi:uncharacterized membrane protein YeaQ/YmgE (transglycosylase-associated protein family)